MNNGNNNNNCLLFFQYDDAINSPWASPPLVNSSALSDAAHALHTTLQRKTQLEAPLSSPAELKHDLPPMQRQKSAATQAELARCEQAIDAARKTLQPILRLVGNQKERYRIANMFQDQPASAEEKQDYLHQIEIVNTVLLPHAQALQLNQEALRQLAAWFKTIVDGVTGAVDTDNESTSKANSGAECEAEQFLQQPVSSLQKSGEALDRAAPAHMENLPEPEPDTVNAVANPYHTSLQQYQAARLAEMHVYYANEAGQYSERDVHLCQQLLPQDQADFDANNVQASDTLVHLSCSEALRQRADDSQHASAQLDTIHTCDEQLHALERDHANQEELEQLSAPWQAKRQQAAEQLHDYFQRSSADEEQEASVQRILAYDPRLPQLVAHDLHINTREYALCQQCQQLGLAGATPKKMQQLQDLGTLLTTVQACNASLVHTRQHGCDIYNKSNDDGIDTRNLKSPNKSLSKRPWDPLRQAAAHQAMHKFNDYDGDGNSDMAHPLAYIDAVKQFPAQRCDILTPIAMNYILNNTELSVAKISWGSAHACVLVKASTEPWPSNLARLPMSQWPKDIMVCDPWFNISCRACDFPQRVKQKTDQWAADGKQVAHNGLWVAADTPAFVEQFTKQTVAMPIRPRAYRRDYHHKLAVIDG